jgi:uncharacterized damage-inducible protein DinB
VKQLLQRFASYNVWANQRLAEITLTLPEGELTKQVVGSFPSIRSTILHMNDAESIWWQRILLEPNITRPSEHYSGTTADALRMIAKQNKLWEAWVAQASLTEINNKFTYRNTRNEEFTQPVFDVLLHMFNHGTYHRGQWVNQLRECGVNKIPATDYIVFSRETVQ